MTLSPRFSLRTLFVLVTSSGVSAGWVAYQLNWIRQPRALIFQFGHAPQIEAWSLRETNDTTPFTAPDSPWNLRLFGEKPFLWIAIMDYERAPIRKLFPEYSEILDAPVVPNDRDN